MTLENSQGNGNSASTSQGTSVPSSSQTSTAANSPATDSGSVASSQSSTDASQSAPAMQNAYSPNFKFKYLAPDGSAQVEKEIDEYLRPIIKDQDTEKKIREMYEKAYGLDAVKNDRDAKTRSMRELEEHLGVFRHCAKNKDIRTALDILGFTKEDILKHAMHLVEIDQLPPEKQAEYQKQQEINQKALTLEQENQRLKEYHTAMRNQQLGYELQNGLSRPEISQVSKEYDSKMGEGRFRQLVIERGELHELRTGEVLSVDQAINQALSIIAYTNPQQAAQVQQAQSNMTNASTPPVIPHIAGKGSSPAKSIPKSLQDLRNRAAAMNASS